MSPDCDANTPWDNAPATLLPDQEASLMFIFDIPPRVEPTALTLKDAQGVKEGDEVEWEIP
jgi:hypothetical protein